MLESLEKLLEELKVCGCDLDDCMLCEVPGKVGKIADAVQAEMDEKYMLLPVDADGVPICPGDQMTDSSQRIDGLGMAKWDVASVNEHVFYDRSGGVHIPIWFHHVKPRTAHDVLQDFREACYRAEQEHGLDSQMYDMAVSEAFKAAEEELMLKEGTE